MSLRPKKHECRPNTVPTRSLHDVLAAGVEDMAVGARAKMLQNKLVAQQDRLGKITKPDLKPKSSTKPVPVKNVEVPQLNFTREQELQIMTRVADAIDSFPTLDIDGESRDLDLAIMTCTTQMFYEFGLIDDALHADSQDAARGLLVHLASENDASVDATWMQFGSAPPPVAAMPLTDKQREQLARNVYQGGPGLLNAALRTKFDAVTGSLRATIDHYKEGEYALALTSASLFTYRALAFVPQESMALLGVPRTFDWMQLPGGDRIKELQDYVESYIIFHGVDASFVDKYKARFLLAKYAIAYLQSPSLRERFEFRLNPVNTILFRVVPPKPRSRFEEHIDWLWLQDYALGPNARLGIYLLSTLTTMVGKYGQGQLQAARAFASANTYDEFKRWHDELVFAAEADAKSMFGPRWYTRYGQEWERDKQVLGSQLDVYKAAITELDNALKSKWFEGIRYSFESVQNKFNKLLMSKRRYEAQVEQRLPGLLSKVEAPIKTFLEYMDAKGITKEALQKARTELDK